MDQLQNTAHLRDYWNIVWRGRYTVLTVFLLAMALAVLRVSLATEYFQATAVLEIKPEGRTVLPGQEAWVGSEGRSWISEELYFNTQLQILQSRDLATRVYNKLPEDRKLRIADPDADPGGTLAGLVKVSPRVNTRLVELSVTHEDPELAALLANELAETFVDRNVEAALEAFDATMDEVDKSMKELERKLGEADVDSGEGETMFAPDDQRAILTQNLQKYHAERATIQVDLGSIKAELDGYERIRREGGDIMSLPRFAQDPVLQTLNATKLSIERDIERLSTEGKRERHPEALAKRRDLETVEKRMADQVELLADEMRENSRMLVARDRNLRNDIVRTEEQARKVDRAATRYEIAKTDVESKRRVYDIVAERIEELSMGATLMAQNNNVAVIDGALLPTSPVRPRKIMILAFGGFLGLVLGVGAVLFLDYLDNTIRTPEDVENSLGLNVLAIVPRFRGASANAVREAYQSLRTSILFSSRDLDHRVLLMTSAGPQEGKSSTVRNLAQSLAASGDSVVVVDCDLRRPTQHKQFEIPREPGLTNYLLSRDADAGYAPFARSIGAGNLRVFPCGPVPPNPTDLVGSPKFRDLIAQLRKDFDWVVIDSPPVASIADTIVLASVVDLLVLVIKHNQNDRDLIRRSLKRLSDVGVQVAGAVLNSMEMSGSYGSYYTAYDYYDEAKAGADTDSTGGEGPSPSAEETRRIAL